MRLSQKQKDLVRHFGAKVSEQAAPQDWLVSQTERGDIFILTPRSKIAKTRRVFAQLAA